MKIINKLKKKWRWPTRRDLRRFPVFSGKVLAAAVMLVILLLPVFYLWHLDRQLRSHFDGQRWEIPARVYARSLELYPGLALSAEILRRELELAGYRQDRQLASAGSYRLDGATLGLHTRAFDFGNSHDPARRLMIRFTGERIAALATSDGQPLELVRLDPAPIAGFHPLQHEDRVLVRRQEIPEALVQALLAVEDRNFYHHRGLDFRGIGRALLANLRARATVQGGSTLTQQLIKNMYLTRERTWGRKLNEAVMALMLERRYDKEEIITAYINEVFLGQDGSRAIHGFGLASQFYFRRQLSDLELPELALLAGLAKGPSYYDPQRFPDRSRQRRDVVLQSMVAAGFISPAEAEQAQAAALDQDLHVTGGSTLFPAFVGLVHRQLRENYREEDLTGQGLKIFTSLDPQVQWRVEQALNDILTRLEHQTGHQRIQAAVVVSRYDSGEIEALAGSRVAGDSGFNRAVDARRPIGSLIKPAVYLCALENGYTLTSLLEDRAIVVELEDGSQWQPRNYDQQEHGTVPLYEALAQSYNLTTVRLGLELGLDRVIETLVRLGLQRPVKPYPSLLLGAFELSPLEVSQFYQTMASGGFYSPQRVINRVTAADNQPLERFPITVEQRLEQEPAFLINTAMQLTISQGTGRPLAAYLTAGLAPAGKTGTSDDLRDSWFAGFTGDRLVVVWLGLDDNRPLGLSGSNGALLVWGEVIRALGSLPLELTTPPSIEWAWYDPQRRERVRFRTAQAIQLPFAVDTVPAAVGRRPGSGDDLDDRGWLGRKLDQLFRARQ